jgi:hypothetical protein
MESQQLLKEFQEFPPPPIYTNRILLCSEQPANTHYIHNFRSYLIKTCFRIVAYFLKARTVEPEKQPLLANGSETTFVSRQACRGEAECM